MDTINIADIKATVEQVVADSQAALISIAKDAEPKVIEATQAYLAGLKTRGVDVLNVVTDQSADKEPDKLAFLKARFKDEEKIFENELVSYEVIGLQVAQDIINTIQGILIKAVFSVLPMQTP